MSVEKILQSSLSVFLDSLETLKLSEIRKEAILSHTLGSHSSTVWSVCALGNEKLASASGSDSNDAITKVWNFVSGKLASVSGVDSNDAIIKIWNLVNGKCEKILIGHESDVLSICALDNGRLASGSRDKTIKIWNIASGVCEKTLSGHSDSVLNVLALGNGKIVSGSYDTTIKLWDVASGRCEEILRGHDKGVLSICVLGNGKLASGAHDCTIKIWNMASGACEKTLRGHDHYVYDVCALDNDRLVSASSDCTIKIWNIANGMCEKTLKGHSGSVLSVCMLENGKLVSGSYDNTIKLWDIATGICEKTLNGHSCYIYSFCTLNNGKFVSSSSDRTIKIWEPQKYILTLEEQSQFLEAVLKNSSLKTLDLSSISLTKVPNGLALLKSILEVHPQIEVLNLSETDLTDNEIQEILPLLIKRKTLRNLVMEGNNLSETVKKHLEEVYLNIVRNQIQGANVMEQKATGNQKSPAIPANYRCPISRHIMLDPVVLSTGVTYEREAIEEWLNKNDICPITRKSVRGNKAVVPNINLKGLIDDFLKKYPACWGEVYDSKLLTQKFINALKCGDKNQIDICLSKDPRFLTPKILENNKNLLVLVCEYSYLEILDFVLKRLGEKFWRFPEVSEEKGLSLVLCLARRLGISGAKRMVEALVWEKSDIQNLLTIAIKNNDLKLAKVALDLGAVVTGVLLRGIQADQKIDLVKLLVDCGAPIGEKDKEGNDFLMYVIKRGDQNLAQFLCVKEGIKVNPNTENYAGETPLSVAIQHGDIILISILLEHPQIDINLSATGGNTPLHLAVEKKNEEMVQMILNEKPHLEIENQQKQTPLDKASVGDTAIIILLLAAGADGERKDDQDENLLMRAMRYDNMTLCHFLLKGLREKTQVDVQNHQGETALMLAAQLGRKDIVELLLAYPEINVDAVDQRGNTALHYAAEKNDQATALLLLKSGASVKVQNQNKQTPIEIAQTKGGAQFARFIKQEYQRKKFAPLFAPLEERIKRQQQLLQSLSQKARFFKEQSSSFVMKLSLNANAPIYSACVLDKGQFATGAEDSTIKIWDIESGKCEKVLTGHTGGIWSICVLDNGKLASGSHDRTIKIWNIASGMCEKTLSGHNNPVYTICALSNGKLASGSHDDTIKIWNIESGTCEKTFSEHRGGVWSICVLDNGKLASGSHDKTIKIWDIASGKCEKTLSGHSNPVYTICALSNGKLASGSYDNTIKLWDIGNGTCEKTLIGHSGVWNNSGGVWSICAALGNTKLVSGAYDNTIRIWDIESGNCEKTLSEHRGGVRSVYVLSNGNLISVSEDNTIKIWVDPLMALGQAYRQMETQIAREFPECKVM